MGIDGIHSNGVKIVKIREENATPQKRNRDEKQSADTVEVKGGGIFKLPVRDIPQITGDEAYLVAARIRQELAGAGQQITGQGGQAFQNLLQMI